MGHPLLRVALALALALAAVPARADLAKLDARARIALAALRGGADPGGLRARRMPVQRGGELDVFVRGPATRAELEAAGARVRTELSGLCTATIPAAAVERVAALAGVHAIRGAAPVELELDTSATRIGVRALRGAGPTFPGANGAGVLVGAVDSGVDFDHGDFEHPDGTTRFIRIWDQDDSGGPAPAGFDYGVEFTAAQIDAGACTQIDPVGHGTHVLGIAAGDGSQTGGAVPAHTYAGIAPRADLVMVKTDFFDTHVTDGIRYCFDLAEARGQSAVVNLSLGSQAGPHDGTSAFERSLDLLSGPGRVVVKSAGNDRATVRHAEVIANGGTVSATFLVSGSTTGAQIQFDGYYESTENLSVRVTPPNGTPLALVTRGNLNANYPGVLTSNGNVYLENGFVRTSTGDYNVYLEINVPAATNANGTWTVTFQTVTQGAARGEVDLWRIYSTIPAPWQIGAQTEELISEPGNAAEVVTVAAFATKSSWIDCNDQTVSFSSAPPVGALATFSSPGPTRDGRRKPDIAAPGTPIVSTSDFDIGVFCSASSLYLGDGLNHRVDQGTSMAAPHVTGAIALMMQSMGPLTPTQVKNYLATTARQDGFTGAVWNADWGAGKLFLDQTVSALLSLFQAEAVSAGIEVRWRLGDPGRFVATTLERAPAASGPWRRVEAERRLDGVVTVALDRDVAPGAVWFYRLVAENPDGSLTTFGPIEASAAGTLPPLSLGPIRPNPASGIVRIDFAVSRPSSIRLSLLDLQGREVAVLADGPHRAGRYQAAWSGSFERAPAPPGLYFVRLRTPDGIRTTRITKIQ